MLEKGPETHESCRGYGAPPPFGRPLVGLVSSLSSHTQSVSTGEQFQPVILGGHEDLQLGLVQRYACGVLLA